MGFETVQLSNAFQGTESISELSIFGTSETAVVDYYTDIQAAMAKMGDSEDGKVKLANGMEVDVNTLTGMTVLTTYLQQLSANMELINNIYQFVKTFENKLGTAAAS